MISREMFSGGRENKEITIKVVGVCGEQNTMLKPELYILKHFSLKYPFTKIPSTMDINLQINIF